MFQRNLPPPPPRKDEFVRDDDRPFFTRILINAGYRAYELTTTLDDPTAGLKVYTVWAKPKVVVTDWKRKSSKRRHWNDSDAEVQPETVAELPDLSAFADGQVIPLPMTGRVVKSMDVIMLDEADGGGIVTGYDRTIL